jgi:hypothetical protein
VSHNAYHVLVLRTTVAKKTHPTVHACDMQEKRRRPKIMRNKGGDDDDATSTNFYVPTAAVGTVTGGEWHGWRGASVAVPFVEYVSVFRSESSRWRKSSRRAH